MKSEGALRHKLKQVRFRHLKKRVADRLRPRPENCIHNRLLKHPLVDDPVGSCIHPDQEEHHNLCDREWGGCEKAKACKLFETAQSKDEVKDEFREGLEASSFAEIAYIYPDMAALMWVLDEEGVEEDWEGMPDMDLLTVTIQGVEVLVYPEVAQVLVRIEEDVVAKLKDAYDTIERRERSLREAESALTQLPEPKPWWKRLFGG